MKKTGIFIALLVLCRIFPMYGADVQRAPIDVNLIIDGSSFGAGLKDEINAWVLSRLDQILAAGDRVTIWNAGTTASVVYTGSINSDSDREALRRSIREAAASSETADFSGALAEAAGRPSSNFSYTLLVCASTSALSSILSSPQANLLRFSRVEEFSGWRALVVGLNLETRVRRAASDFIGS